MNGSIGVRTIPKVLAGLAVAAAGVWAWRRRRSRRQDAAGEESHATELWDPIADEASRHGTRSVDGRVRTQRLDSSDAARDALDRAIAEVAEAEFKRLSDQLVTDSPGAALGRAVESLHRGLEPQSQPSYSEWEALYYLRRFLPRQVNLAYSILRGKYPEGIRTGFRMVDVGCGPRVAQLAVSVLAAEGAGASSVSDVAKRVAVAGIEPSGPMRALGEKLWRAYRCAAEDGKEDVLVDAVEMLSGSSETFSSFAEFKGAEWARANWPGSEASGQCDWWLTAFHSVYVGNLEELIRTIDEVYALCEEEEVEPVFLFSTHEKKRGLLDRLEDDFGGCLKEPELFWKGVLVHTDERTRGWSCLPGVRAHGGWRLKWRAKWESMKGEDVVREC